MPRPRNPICPRCKDRPKEPGQSYCGPCRGRTAHPGDRAPATPLAVTLSNRLDGLEARVVALERGGTSLDAAPAPIPVKVLTVAQVRKRFPAPKPEKGSILGHGPYCQCLACRGRAQ